MICCGVVFVIFFSSATPRILDNAHAAFVLYAPWHDTNIDTRCNAMPAGSAVAVKDILRFAVCSRRRLYFGGAACQKMFISAWWRLIAPGYCEKKVYLREERGRFSAAMRYFFSSSSLLHEIKFFQSFLFIEASSFLLHHFSKRSPSASCRIYTLYYLLLSMISPPRHATPSWMWPSIFH